MTSMLISKNNLSRAGMAMAGLLMIMLGLLVWRYTAHTATLLAYPYEWDEDEGYHVYFAKCLLQGKPIYGDINQAPILPQTYPPVHAAVLSLFVKVLGATLLAGRLVSLLAVAGLAVVVVLVLRQETGRWSLGVLAAGLVLGSPFVAVWGPLCRVDSLMLFFVLAGLLVIRQYPRSRLALVPGLLLLLLACYTKQQAVVFLPAAFLHLWQHSRRTALFGMAGLAAAGLVVLVVLQLWSGGAFWQNAVTGQATEFRLGLIITHSKDFLALHALLVAGAAGWIAYQVNMRRLEIWSAFAISAVALIILAGKNGAAFHYCLAAVVAAILCAMLALDRLWRSLPAAWPAAIAAQVLFLLLIVQGLVFWSQQVSEPSAADRLAGDRILSLVRGCRGDPLIERRAMFSVLAERQPQADFCLLYFLHQQDQQRAKAAWPPGSYHPGWEPSALVQAASEKRFPLVVMEPKFVPEEVVSTVMANYRSLEQQPISIGNWHGQNAYQIGVPK
jgi:4-amino-4-deoxy-L-arabinose transferase-like glycosyltransferase